jgi:hypothetical protein
MIYRFLIFFAVFSVFSTLLYVEASYAEADSPQKIENTSESPLAHKSKSGDEHVAFTYFSLTRSELDFAKIAMKNNKEGANYKEAKIEINRLQDLLARIEPREDYIIINDITGFSAAQGAHGEPLFTLTDINKEYFHRFSYQNMNFMVAANDIQTLSEIELSGEALRRFLQSYDQNPSIAFSLHVKAKFAAREPLVLEDEKKYQLIAGDIAYMGYLDRTGQPIWEYKAPWYGHSVKSDLKELYHKDEVRTMPEVDINSGTIKDLYNER